MVAPADQPVIAVQAGLQPTIRSESTIKVGSGL